MTQNRIPLSIVALAICLFFLSALHAETVGDLQECYNKISGPFSGYDIHSIWSDVPEARAYILDKSVTQNEFHLFNNGGIYKCSLPSQNPVKELFQSCMSKDRQIGQQTYNLELKIGGRAPIYTSYVRQNAPPFPVVATGGSFSTDGQQPDGNWCNVNCSEDLSPATKKMAEDQVADAVQKVYNNFAAHKSDTSSALRGRCTNVLAAGVRGFKDFFGMAYQTEDDCVTAANKSAALQTSDRAKGVLDSLQHCRGTTPEIDSLASDQEAKIHESISATTPTNQTFGAK